MGGRDAFQDEETMGAKKRAGRRKGTAIAADDPELRRALRRVGGSKSPHWNNVLVRQAVDTLWLDEDTRVGAIVGAVMGIGPRDELEGMMAAPLVAAHN